MFHVSQINLYSCHKIETKTDAVRYVENEHDRTTYIEEFGDVVVVWDAKYRTWRVPAHKEEIAEFVQAKMVQCEKWGCN